MVVEHARPPVRRPVAMHSGAAVARRLVNVAPSVAGGVTFASALVVLAGWAFNVGVLKSVHPTPAWTLRKAAPAESMLSGILASDHS